MSFFNMGSIVWMRYSGWAAREKTSFSIQANDWPRLTIDRRVVLGNIRVRAQAGKEEETD
eukprot:1159038-Pelagomonas_calceolata.AAC.1